jgi:hypothetical protein
MRARIPTTTEVTQIHACVRLYSTMEKNRVKEELHCCHALDTISARQLS